MISDVVKPQVKDVDGLPVRRLLPSAGRKMVGPFIFFDHMGPAQFRPGEGLDVRPHPHIGLATVTYLFDGAIMHRDSLGCEQRITPGDVNWMTAGHGIVHSERSPDHERSQARGLHGIQIWIALPRADERTDPEFVHHPKATLPVLQWPEVEMRLIAGSGWGEHSPVKIYSPMFYGAVTARSAARFELPAEHEERAIYVIDGKVTADGEPVMPHTIAVFDSGAAVEIATAGPARLMVFGGARLDGDRFIHWNFVASSRELIEEARMRWREQRFPRVPNETEFIPLPER
ncbi:MAG: pirin family protein [Burkholderiales bacterium]|nr:pirin family protein [Burkholderiales bacterium]MDP2398683.1 pirin family protein [Burkholderiales bacterium]